MYALLVIRSFANSKIYIYFYSVKAMNRFHIFLN